MKPLTLATILALLLAYCLMTSLGQAQAASKLPTLTKEQWRQDLQYLAKELPKRHKNLFHAVSREQFEAEITKLDAAIPTLQDHQIIARMLQITAKVGDGHTGVHLPPYFKRYPLGVYWFDHDLRVTSAAKEYQSALGTRVVRIGSLSINEVQARVTSCFPSAENENQWYVMSTSPAFMLCPEILHALEVVPDLARAPFTFEDEQGKQFTLEISPIEIPVVGGVPTLRLLPVAKEEPLYRQKPGEGLWYTYLADSQTVYVNFRRYPKCNVLGWCQEFDDLMKFVDQHQPARLVIDMRQNGGGDFTKVRGSLIPAIKKRPAINQKGHLFVIIGRRTFSAAMANATDFRKETNAILVGEPIGERPNSYSENDEMTLPNSGLVLSYSTRYYKFVDEDVPAVMPDKRIDPNWPAYKAGRDPVMEWIVAYPGGK